MSSRDYFSFLGTVFSLLPESDKQRFGELWHGYEQVFASVYQKFVEDRLNVSIANLQPFTTERWLPYTFSADNQILLPATLAGTQDLSVGINLTSRYLFKFSWDAQPAIEIDLRGLNPQQTLIDEIITKINAAAGFKIARGIFENTIIQMVSPTSGPTSNIRLYPTSIADKNAAEFILGALIENDPLSFPKFAWSYTLPYDRVSSIPSLQNTIREEVTSSEAGDPIFPVTLTEGTDYQVDPKSKLLSFSSEPPSTLWARRTLVDEETPWNNFGFLMDIYQPNTASYTSVLQGLWFAFWSGSKPENVRSSIYLLFGLPTAQENATVTALTSTVIETTSSAGLVREYTIPSGLLSEVAVGDAVTRFQPLVTGISVFDKLNRPGFIEDEIGRPGIQRFLTEHASTGTDPDSDETKAMLMLEENTFLPQIQVEAFIRPDINLANVRTFLSAIQPLNKTFLFQVVVGTFKDPIPMQEDLALGIGIDITPNVDSNQSTWTENDLEAYDEGGTDEGLNLDSDGSLLADQVEIEVRSFGILIDSFIA